MDCSNYGLYNYFQAMKIFKGYEQPEPRNYPGSEFVLPPGEYKLKLTTFYEEDLSGETKHELISTEYIKVKAKNNWKSMNESKITKNFKLEANLNKNIFEDDEFIRLWSSMIYCGEEDSIVFPYMTFYPLEIYIYNDKHEELELDYTIYFNLDEGKELTNTKPLYYAPLTRLKLPTGKYTAEFLFYYPNENGEIVNDTIEMDFEIVPKTIY